MQAKEESVEMGGYFICNGIERIIRMLIQQRRHYIMALRRSAYHKRGNNYTDAATLIRCDMAHHRCLAAEQTYHHSAATLVMVLHQYADFTLSVASVAAHCLLRQQTSVMLTDGIVGVQVCEAGRDLSNCEVSLPH